MKKLIILISLLVIMTTMPSVFAGAPDVEVIEAEFVSVTDCSSFGLGDAIITGTATVNNRITTFYDNKGNPTRIQIQVRWNIVDAALNGTPLDDGLGLLRRFIVIDLIEGTTTVNGLVHQNITFGQGGAIVELFDMGRYVVDSNGNVIFEAGQVQPPPEYLVTLCTLAP